MLCMPGFDEEFVLEALIKLLEIEKDRVPSAPGTSLYIRPTIIATDAYIGLRSSNTYRFFIILSSMAKRRIPLTGFTRWVKPSL